ncbi:Large exoprotein involved in heme utilization or adhesion [Candidatus Burkholderia brachyanthoides]|nr:Large exoprotein involved in heme utilization or adhesion [Candidatus Burkholderia brachyanthoides]
MKTRMAGAVAWLSIILAACGGGGNDAPATTTPGVSAAGQYQGTVNGRHATILILDDGRFYTEYSNPYQSTLIAGVAAGNATSGSGVLSGGSGNNYNLEGQGVSAVSLSGSFIAKQSIKASVAYANGAKSDFTGAPMTRATTLHRLRPR